MFNLFGLFKKQEEEYVTITRRGFNIILSKKDYEFFKNEHYSLGIIVNPKTKLPCSIQVNKNVKGKTKYYGTLKSWLNVKTFKDGNICNFHKSNIIKEDN